jgi:predicted nucleic acid-binding protein
MITEAMDQQETDRAAAAAERAARHLWENARQLASVLARTAETLDESARLAEQHAQRCDESDLTETAEGERRGAKRAHEAAAHARAQAEYWHKWADGT